jgi:hypothetical protein
VSKGDKRRKEEQKGAEKSKKNKNRSQQEVKGGI